MQYSYIFKEHAYDNFEKILLIVERYIDAGDQPNHKNYG